jgi:SNF2 family DNA or RNA helicase
MEVAGDFGLNWLHSLFPYQQTGVNALLTRPSLLLADEMGLGKTVQAIAALRCLFVSGAVRTALIVAPAGLLLQWRRELRIWAPDIRVLTVTGSAGSRLATWRAEAQVFVASYESIRADIGIAEVNRDWDLVIIDEAQRIKNPATELAQTVKKLSRRRSWALSGTPLENRLDDLLSVLEFVAPDRIHPGILAYGVRRILSDVQLRRTRAEVLHDLPPKLPAQIELALEPHQRAAYERAENAGLVRLNALGAELRINHVLELILRLKQICNFCPQTGASAKLTDLRERLKQAAANGERALVFSQFAAEPFGIKRLARELSEFCPMVISGDVPADARDEIVREFASRNSSKLLLSTLRAGGVGLNLTAASYVFHFDSWWNPAVETQAEDRAHRIGQTRPVNVYTYICADTIEERIATVLAQKRTLFSSFIEGVSLREIRRLELADLLSAVSPPYK